LRKFRLPGGASAIKEPRRAAIGVLYELLGDELFERSDIMPLQAFDPAEVRILRQMLEKAVNSPVTSSAGRLFDAVASISGLRQKVNFEGQAAMELEFAASGQGIGESYPFDLTAGRNDPEGSEMILVDWGPMMLAILSDLKNGMPIGTISCRFHRSLSEMIVAVAQRVAMERVALSGGCFQNKFLTEYSVRRLEQEGFRPYWHQRIPPNDGGIAMGQIAAVLRSLRKE
jgi:hydrogenase maturation protein HypF